MVGIVRMSYVAMRIIRGIAQVVVDVEEVAKAYEAVKWSNERAADQIKRLSYRGCSTLAAFRTYQTSMKQTMAQAAAGMSKRARLKVEKALRGDLAGMVSDNDEEPSDMELRFWDLCHHVASPHVEAPIMDVKALYTVDPRNVHGESGVLSDTLAVHAIKDKLRVASWVGLRLKRKHQMRDELLRKSEAGFQLTERAIEAKQARELLDDGGYTRLPPNWSVLPVPVQAGADKAGCEVREFGTDVERVTSVNTFLYYTKRVDMAGAAARRAEPVTDVRVVDTCYDFAGAVAALEALRKGLPGAGDLDEHCKRFIQSEYLVAASRQLRPVTALPRYASLRTSFLDHPRHAPAAEEVALLNRCSLSGPDTVIMLQSSSGEPHVVELRGEPTRVSVSRRLARGVTVGSAKGVLRMSKFLTSHFQVSGEEADGPDVMQEMERDRPFTARLSAKRVHELRSAGWQPVSGTQYGVVGSAFFAMWQRKDYRVAAQPMARTWRVVETPLIASEVAAQQTTPAGVASPVLLTLRVQPSCYPKNDARHAPHELNVELPEVQCPSTEAVPLKRCFAQAVPPGARLPHPSEHYCRLHWDLHVPNGLALTVPWLAHDALFLSKDCYMRLRENNEPALQCSVVLQVPFQPLLLTATFDADYAPPVYAFNAAKVRKAVHPLANVFTPAGRADFELSHFSVVLRGEQYRARAWLVTALRRLAVLLRRVVGWHTRMDSALVGEGEGVAGRLCEGLSRGRGLVWDARAAALHAWGLVAVDVTTMVVRHGDWDPALLVHHNTTKHVFCSLCGEGELAGDDADPPELPARPSAATYSSLTFTITTDDTDDADVSFAAHVDEDAGADRESEEDTEGASAADSDNVDGDSARGRSAATSSWHDLLANLDGGQLDALNGQLSDAVIQLEAVNAHMNRWNLTLDIQRSLVGRIVELQSQATGEGGQAGALEREAAAMDTLLLLRLDVEAMREELHQLLQGVKLLPQGGRAWGFSSLRRVCSAFCATPSAREGQEPVASVPAGQSAAHIVRGSDRMVMCRRLHALRALPEHVLPDKLPALATKPGLSQVAWQHAIALTRSLELGLGQEDVVGRSKVAEGLAAAYDAAMCGSLALDAAAGAD